jgi:hypothetical protein
MQTLFKITTGNRKPVNKLEAHLIEVANAWCAGKATIELKTLDHFHHALQREKELYCADNRGFRSSSVMVARVAESDLVTLKVVITSANNIAKIELNDDDDLAYDVQAAHSSGYYTPRFLH